jgi:lysophospholipase L1-like esterase
MRPTIHRALSALAFCVIVSLAVSASGEPPSFTPKADDLWVMAGDSITAQRLHTNYIEAFYRTRYPQLNLRFRNSGIGGNRTGNILARFDYDVAAWKPSIVSIELGMNDVNGGDDPAGYVKGERELIGKIRDAGARPVLISSSPVNDGSLPGDWKSDRCRRLDPYTDALKKLAAEEGVICIDQYHPLLELWGKNRAKGSAAVAAAEAATPGAGKEAAKKYSTGLISLHGDAVHPQAVGQYTMAATILMGLGAEREVSSATLKADGTVVDARKCKISDASAQEGKLSFTRLDDCGPWPIDPKARDAMALMPQIVDLSRYMLTVTGLPAGQYKITIDAKPAATLSEKELAAGWNMSAVFEGALAERSTKIVELIGKLQGKLNNDWRAASKEKNKEKLAAAQQAIDECERDVRAACQPAALHFEIQAAK